MTYPFNDEYMRYDYDEHRYILTQRAVLDKNNINLMERLNYGGDVNRERVADIFLDEISELVYSEIYNYSSQPAIPEYQIAKTPSARNAIMKAMLKQVDYVLVNGFINQYGGVDFKKGTKMESTADRYLAPLSKNILTRPLAETKVPLMYAGKYSVIFEPHYEEWGY